MMTDGRCAGEYTQLMECSPNGYLLSQSPSRPIAITSDSQPQGACQHLRPGIMIRLLLTVQCVTITRAC